MTNDLTEGRPIKLIIGFAIPVFCGILFQQFYSLVDTMIVGRFLGATALAAVGSTGAINFLILGFCNGLCSGFAIPVARTFGAGEHDTMRKIIANCVWLSFIFALVLTLLTVILCKQFLVLMGTPKDILEHAYQYIVIIFAGLPITILYNMLAGILRSVGDSKTPVFFLALAACVNILLDIVLIGTLHFGVEGAAIATVISQALSGVLCLLYIRSHYPILKLKKEDWHLKGELIRKLCADGIPMGLQYSITAIGSVILQTAINSLGTAAVASITAANKLSMFFCAPFEALGSTMATYGGQNIGARKVERIGKGVKAGILIGFVYSLMAFGVLLVFGKELTTLFIDASESEIIDHAYLSLLLNSGAFMLLTLIDVLRFMIQGLGYGHIAICAGFLEMVARAIAGIFLVPVLGFLGACIASPLAWVFADIFLIPVYYFCINKCKRQKESMETSLEEGI